MTREQTKGICFLMGFEERRAFMEQVNSVLVRKIAVESKICKNHGTLQKRHWSLFFFELFLRDLEGTEPVTADVYIHIYLFFVVLHQSSMQCHNANLRNSRESDIFLQLFPY